MKKTWIMLVALALSACGSDDIQPAGAWGTLTIERVEKAEAAQVSVVTRAVAEGLQLDVLNGSGSVVRHFAEGAAQTGAEQLNLAPGAYRLRAYSANYQRSYAATEMGEPKWYGEQAFTVRAGEDYRVGLEVPMTNIGVRFSLPEGSEKWFTLTDFTATLGSRTVSVQEGQTAYFDLAAGANLLFSLQLRNTDGEVFSVSGSREAAQLKNGTIYEVRYNVRTRQLAATPLR